MDGRSQIVRRALYERFLMDRLRKVALRVDVGFARVRHMVEVSVKQFCVEGVVPFGWHTFHS